MTQNPDAGSRPSLMGDAPRLALTLLPALAAALALTLLLPGAFGFSGKLRGLAVLAGVELAAAGLLLWGSAAFELIRAWKRGRLAARGAYGLCRHPIFGWWIWSVLPALALLLDSWLLLLTAVLFWALSRPLARSEERELTARFGEEYRRYRERTRSTLPLPLLRPLTLRRCGRAAAGLALLGAFALAVYFAAARPLLLRLGATRAEAAAALPGDEHVSRPRNLYTQAVTIGAPAEEVWKWLVQVGWRRAGWYNLDAINRLADPRVLPRRARLLDAHPPRAAGPGRGRPGPPGAPAEADRHPPGARPPAGPGGRPRPAGRARQRRLDLPARAGGRRTPAAWWSASAPPSPAASGRPCSTAWSTRSAAPRCSSRPCCTG